MSCSVMVNSRVGWPWETKKSLGTKVFLQFLHAWHQESAMPTHPCCSSVPGIFSNNTKRANFQQFCFSKISVLKCEQPEPKRTMCRLTSVQVWCHPRSRSLLVMTMRLVETQKEIGGAKSFFFVHVRRPHKLCHIIYSTYLYIYILYIYSTILAPRMMEKKTFEVLQSFFGQKLFKPLKVFSGAAAGLRAPLRWWRRSRTLTHTHVDTHTHTQSHTHTRTQPDLPTLIISYFSLNFPEVQFQIPKLKLRPPNYYSFTRSESASSPLTVLNEIEIKTLVPVFPSNATSWNWLFDSRAQQHCFPFFFAMAMMRIPVWHIFNSMFLNMNKKNRIQLSSFLWCSGNCVIFSHKIHVWYIYIYLYTYIWLNIIFIVSVGKTYHTWILWVRSDNHITVLGHGARPS